MSKKRLRREKARLKALAKAEAEAPAQSSEQPSVSVHPIEQSHHVPSHRPKSKGIKGIYENKYKLLLLIPFIILFLAILQIGFQYTTTGDFINKGVSLKGGITVTMPGIMADNIELKDYLSGQFPGYDINVRKITSAGVQTGLLIDGDITKKDDILAFLDTLDTKLSVTRDDYNIEEIGSSLGESFFKETLIALGTSTASSSGAYLAVKQLKKLRGCEMHLTHMPPPGDEAGLRDLGILLTSDPHFSSNRLLAN